MNAIKEINKNFIDEMIIEYSCISIQLHNPCYSQPPLLSLTSTQFLLHSCFSQANFMNNEASP